MKKFMVIFVLLIGASSIYAQEYGRLGIGVNGSFFRWKEENASGTNEDDNFDFTVGVSFSAMLGESLELRPQILYGYGKETTDGSQDDGGFSVGGGVGLYWHALKTAYIRVGPGVFLGAFGSFDTYPSSDSANAIVSALRMPLMVEFLFLRNFAFRLEYSMVSVGAYFTQANNDDRDNYTYVQILPTAWGGSLGETSMMMDMLFPMLTFGFTFRF